MLSAVQVCHEKGIVLDDFKLNSFVFTSDDKSQIKLFLLDYVHVLKSFEVDFIYSHVGCLEYLSPDKALAISKKQSFQGKANDVWVLGCLLYRLLTGQILFQADTKNEKFQKLFTESLPSLTSLPDPVQSILLCMLDKNPKLRPSCYEILQFSWFHC